MRNEKLDNLIRHILPHLECGDFISVDFDDLMRQFVVTDNTSLSQNEMGRILVKANRIIIQGEHYDLSECESDQALLNFIAKLGPLIELSEMADDLSELADGLESLSVSEVDRVIAKAGINEDKGDAPSAFKAKNRSLEREWINARAVCEIEDADRAKQWDVRVPAKPVIGLNTDYRLAKDGSTAFHCLSARYAEAVSEVGAIPVVLPLIDDDEDLARVLDMLDGVVLVGGGDLDPRNDGFMLHPSVRPMERARERFDRRLAKMIYERYMPVYGIGVGMQLLNVTAGGNLFSHLAEDMPNALPHCDNTDPSHRHALEIEMGTLMERVYGEGEIRVNSMHHMAVDQIAPGFKVTARCPDGVVEAIESEHEDWFVLGTQFHPEASSASKLDMRIFEEFVKAVRMVQATKLKSQSSELKVMV